MTKGFKAFKMVGGILVFTFGMAIAVGSAEADTYNFSYVGASSVWGNGTLTTGASLGNGYFAITSIAGVTSQGTITGLETSAGAVATPPNNNNCCGFIYDNAFSPGSGTFGTPFDNNGVLFDLNSVASPMNIYGDGQNDGRTFLYSYNGPQEEITFTSSVSTTSSSATPEPGFYGVLALGLGGIAILAWRRKRTNAA